VCSSDLADAFRQFLQNNVTWSDGIDLMISGENGDNRLLPNYLMAEELVGNEVPVARFKHLSGEYETVTAIAFKLACELLTGKVLPSHMLKTGKQHNKVNNILLYNTCKGYQHSFAILSKPNY